MNMYITFQTFFTTKGWVKRKVIAVAETLPKSVWKDFRIVPYEDRTVKGGRPY